MILSYIYTFLFFLGIFYTGFKLDNSKLKYDLDREEIRWNWDTIRLDAREVAIRIKRHTKEFIWGTATAGNK